ncbi:DUF3231 family protein [Paenibacillus albiflavus]|uniref:DUF3231 family protein n=1 Tax=Paenibacillus albiflavus TaxID=2545760 RepID=A0A4R4EDQ0_9BACL|nr:DUF3231 family protein [Paenibacillus albiflavus]TCZ76135.1 DUF3231 family protein [Paenibacillus albiflavus]
MGILSGDPKDEPLHYGEIYNMWQFSTASKGLISINRLYYFHAGDKDLKEIIEDVINQAELEVSECDTILIANGIATSPSLPQRPEVKLEEIPVGARFSDQELSVIVAAGLSAGLVGCSAIIGTSIREDVGALFAKYHATKAVIGLKILRLSKEKGWVIPPPLQVMRPVNDN